MRGLIGGWGGYDDGEYEEGEKVKESSTVKSLRERGKVEAV